MYGKTSVGVMLVSCFYWGCHSGNLHKVVALSVFWDYPPHAIIESNMGTNIPRNISVRIPQFY